MKPLRIRTCPWPRSAEALRTPWMIEAWCIITSFSWRIYSVAIWGVYIKCICPYIHYICGLNWWGWGAVSDGRVSRLWSDDLRLARWWCGLICNWPECWILRWLLLYDLQLDTPLLKAESWHIIWKHYRCRRTWRGAITDRLECWCLRRLRDEI